MTEDDKYQEKLYENSDITVGGAITLLLCFALRHSLTKVALDDLLELLNIIMPLSALPRTRFLFSKLFKLCQEKVERHFYCTSCSICTYIGQVINIAVCPVCNANMTNNSNIGFFLVLPVPLPCNRKVETLGVTTTSCRLPTTKMSRAA